MFVNMRVLTVKRLCSRGAILASVLFVALFISVTYRSMFTSEISRRQETSGVVFHVENVVRTRQLENSDISTPTGICCNTTLKPPSPHGTLDLNVTISERFKARRNFLSTECDAAKEREAYKTCEETEVKQNLKVSKRSNIVYCAIEKAGSTFWKRILYLIGENSNVSNPTCINHTQADYGKNSFSDMINKTWEEIEDIFKVSKTVMFVRNPYSRLFSAWLDKFYSPNVDYWNISGRTIAKHQRRNYEDKCTSDITFLEFVNHTADTIISSSQCVDRHFSPNYKHCNPCKLRFDYIGKYETMKDDTLFIIKALNLTNVVTFSDFEHDAAVDAITDAADWVFYQKNKLTECGLTFRCALFRVWQRLQSRGYISCKKSFPFLQGEAEISQEDFEVLLRSAHDETSVDEAFSNRQESLSQALNSLPENVLRKVHRAFGKDFDLFEYERDLEFGEYDATNAYAYFKECPPNL